jgi:hypothetical protein
VIALEPDDTPACSILNTDVVVDLQPPIGPDGRPIVIPEGSDASNRLGRQMSGSQLSSAVLSLGGPAAEFTLAMADPQYKYLQTFQVRPGTPFVLVLHCVSSESPTADFEVYLGDGPGKPTLEQHYLTCNVGEYVRSAKIAVSARPGHHAYRVGLRPHVVEGSVPSGDIVVSARLLPEDTRSTEDNIVPMIEDGQVKCPNCEKMVPAARASLHQAYCSRNNSKCLVCERTLRKADQATHWHCGECTDPLFLADTHAGRVKHLALFHSDIECGCGAVTLPLLPLQAHYRDDCPAREITCRFCFNEMAAGAAADDPADRFRGYTEHESRCGSKTTQCHKCGVHIRRRDLEAHAKLHMFDPEPSTKAPGGSTSTRLPTKAERDAAWARAGFGSSSAPVSSGGAGAAAVEYPLGFFDPVKATDGGGPAPQCTNEGCARPAEQPANGLKICLQCWGRLPTPSSRTSQSLAKSLVKAYFVQLSKGCQEDGCANPQCASGSSGGAVVGNAGAALAVQLAQQALSGHVQLCVGADGRAFAESVTALQGMGFPPEWASCALDKTGSQHDAAVWLLSNYSPPPE